MISYIIPESPDHRILSQASQILTSGGLICLALDTNWVVLTDPFQKMGTEALYRFRHVDNTKHFTVFCADFHQASEIAYIEDSAFRILRRVVPGPYTFIFKPQKKILKHLKASKTDHEVGIRFPPSKLLESLLKTHGHPLIGSHLTHEMLPDHPEDIPIWSGLIDDTFSHQIGMILDSGETHFSESTTIVSFSEGAPELIRMGAGDVSLFGL